MTTDADRPAADPKNSSSAGAKSFELIPCRYINGSTSATFGDLRAHGGMIELRNRRRSPGRLVDPAVVHPRRHHLDRPGAGHDLAGLGVPVADHQPLAVLVELVDQARHVGVDLGLQRRGQHPPGALTDQFIQTRTQLRARSCRQLLLSTSAFLPRRGGNPDGHVVSVRKVRRALEPMVHPQVLVITPPRLERSADWRPPAGAIFGFVKALVDRAGAAGFERATGQ